MFCRPCRTPGSLLVEPPVPGVWLSEMQSPSLWSVGRWVGILARGSRASKPAPPSDLDRHPQSPARSSWAPWGWHQLLAPCRPVSEAPKGRCPERAWRPSRARSFKIHLKLMAPVRRSHPPGPPAQVKAPRRPRGSWPPRELSAPQAEPQPLLFHERIHGTLNRQREPRA